jgi:spore coat protein H
MKRSALVCLAGLLALAVSAAEKEAKNPNEPDALFDEPRVVQLRIEIPTASLEVLKKDPRMYAKASVREGEKVYADAGIRLKGSATVQALDRKPGLSLKFNEFVTGTRFHGHTRVLLNSVAQDPAYLCEVLNGELYRAAGVPTPKANFARVELNGRDLGLYVIAQTVTGPFLAQYFKKGKGNLYEGENADVDERLEKDSGDESKDQGDLKALAAAAQLGDPGQRLRKLGELLDLDRFLTLCALDVLTGNPTGYALGRNNYRVYHDPNSNRLVFIPHGLDRLCEKVNAPLLPEWKGLVAKAVIETSDGQRRYREQMARLLATVFKVDAVQARITELAGQARPGVPQSLVKDFEAAVAQLRERVAERAKAVEQQLKQPPK